jgi:outer membrane protein OmpA-like peptidoglycan-associated protein
MHRLSSRRPGSSRVLARFFGLILFAVPLTAGAADLGFKVEPGVAIPLTTQQSDRFNVGAGMPVKLLYGVGRYVDLTADVSFMGLPTTTNSLSSGTGTAWGYGGGLRLKGPHDSDWNYGMSPWIDADLLYVRTGSLNRLGFSAGAGLAFPIGEMRKYWLGPYVRYQQVVGHDNFPGVDGRDAKVILAGLSFEFGTSRMQPRFAQQSAMAVPAVMVAPAVAAMEPDRDNDGTPDKDDWCPDVVGRYDNHGCPIYEKVIVKPDKLELKEKIQFAWDSPTIEPASHPALDEVVKALQDNRGFRVALEGHSSSEGMDEHNQTLSEERAQAVLNYLVGHGLAKDRVGSKGFSSSRPLESNTTASGREANRRVEFVVHFIIVEKGSIQ